MSKKYIVLLGDGMADLPVPELDNKTPLQVARKPNMDRLAQMSVVGMVKTIPDGMPPASDVANLSIMGYNPKKYYTGRSPLEAISMGVDLSEDDVALRCNLVTLSEDGEYENKTIIDHSSDEISTDEAKILLKSVSEHFQGDNISFHPGVSYRHCMIWAKGSMDLDLTPPHDILGKKITDYLPKGENSEFIKNMMVESFNFLKDHPVNIQRKNTGLKPANSIWLWGQGRKPRLPLFFEKYKKTGSVISAVDLIKGIGICAGLKSVDVEGATGNIHTNFRGKALAALRELESGKDFVYIHIEAPDECGHRYEIGNKVKSIELIDQLVLGELLKGLADYAEYRILVLPDHPTPLSFRTHTPDPVPFIMYDNKKNFNSGVTNYSESDMEDKGIYVEKGFELLNMFFD